MHYTVDVTTTVQENGDTEIKATVRGQDGKAFRTTYRLTSNELRVSNNAEKLIAHHKQRVSPVRSDACMVPQHDPRPPGNHTGRARPTAAQPDSRGAAAGAAAGLESHGGGSAGRRHATGAESEC